MSCPPGSSRNRRTAWVLASIALAMFVGYVLRRWLLG